MPKYNVQLDLSEINDSRSLAIARVPGGSRVLDVGIGDGTVGRTLRKLRCRVWGVEYDKELAEASRETYEELLVGDVEQVDLSDAFGDVRFDVVLLLDVLEHLRSPTDVLERIRDVLDPDGFVVISLPNIAHAAVQLQLLEGRFRYTDEGLLDSTHLRFFDFDNVQSLLDRAGFTMFNLARVTRHPTNTEIPVDLDAFPSELLARMARQPESETYQFVLMAAPRGSAVLSDPPFTQAMALQEEVSRLEIEIAALREMANRPGPNLETIGYIGDLLRGVHERALNDQTVLRGLVRYVEQEMRHIRTLLDSDR
ncbi:MAG TPA: class I SAM-dependent methyltransferase [Acidimicrobiales bacterium]|nr:class I SAM-dependent methyltransferase [Acidimicrobiales bacterium]